MATQNIVTGREKDGHDGVKQDARREGRELAMQFLYQLSVQVGENMGQLESFLKEYGQSHEAKARARLWIQGTWEHREELDELLREVSSHWDLARMNLVDRSILRLALYQLRYCPDIPEKVVLNEAIELGKRFSTAQAPGFINGIVDAVRQRAQATEQTEGE